MNEQLLTENDDNFVAQQPDAKLQRLIRLISREVRHQRLNYDQLRYVWRAVRSQCGIEVPCQTKRLIELPTAEELERFYTVIKRPDHRLLFEFLEGTGLRVSELCNLLVSRMDFATNRIFVSEGKGQKDRICLMGNRLKEKVLLYLHGRKNVYLFESNRNSKYSARRIEQICEGYKLKAGVEKDLTPHTFRHIWNTHLAQHNIPEEKRAILAGHSENSDIQKTYTHLALAGFSNEVIQVLDQRK